MGRLVDIDEVIRIAKGTFPNEDVRKIAWVLCYTPTAYDVENVVAEFEEFTKLAEDRWVNGTSNHAYQEHKCWVKAIDIVKRGGVND